MTPIVEEVVIVTGASVETEIGSLAGTVQTVGTARTATNLDWPDIAGFLSGALPHVGDERRGDIPGVLFVGSSRHGTSGPLRHSGSRVADSQVCATRLTFAY